MEELSFGQWLSRHRKLLGMTQKQLAERVNCAAITIRKIEAEQRRPSLQVVGQLAQLLNIPSGELNSFLLFARGSAQQPPSVSEPDFPSSLSKISVLTKLPTTLLSQLRAGQVQHNSRSILPEGKFRLLPLTGQAMAEIAEAGEDLNGEQNPLPDGNRYIYLLVQVEIANQLALANTQLPEITGMIDQSRPKLLK